MTKRVVSDLLVHNFPENGVKFLLHNPGNLRDLARMLALRYTTLPDPDYFDFAGRTIEPDTLIHADFRHAVTDLLVRLPFRIGGQAEGAITVYLLFEHLSKHQRHIVPRSLGYALDAYRVQERRWMETHDSLQGLLYEVVVPVVIYTGERPWHTPTAFRDLVRGGDVFTAFIPATEPLFLSLPGLTEQELLESGGAFGTILHVLQQRHATPDDFHELLGNAVAATQGRLPANSHRLQELLLYLEALVYHFRSGPEHAGLLDGLERAIESKQMRREIHTMGQTMAEILHQRGKREGELAAKQQALILLLRRKFGRKLTAAIKENVEKTIDLGKLDGWLGNTLDAETLADVGIPLKK